MFRLGPFIDRLIAQNDQWNRHWRTPLGHFLRNRDQYDRRLYVTTFALRLTMFILLTLIKALGKVHMFVLSSMEFTLILMGALLFAAIFTRGDGEMPSTLSIMLFILAILQGLGSLALAGEKMSRNRW